MERKAIIANVKAEGEGDARTFTATITTNAVDRDGEVLLPEGLDATDYDKNPVVFWNHNYDSPIGTATSLKRHRDHWTADVRLSSNDEAGKIHGLMKEGIVRGVSVGFMPVEHRNPSKKDKELFGDGVNRVFSKWKLLEFSVTPLPANQNALITSVSKMVNKGQLSPSDAKTLLDVDVDVSCSGTVEQETDGSARRVVLLVCSDKTENKPVEPLDQKIKRLVRREIARKMGRAYL